MVERKRVFKMTAQPDERVKRANVFNFYCSGGWPTLPPEHHAPTTVAKSSERVMPVTVNFIHLHAPLFSHIYCYHGMTMFVLPDALAITLTHARLHAI